MNNKSSWKLEADEIDDIAMRAGFFKKVSKKITASAFVLSCFKLFEEGRHSLQLWAFAISLDNQVNVSAPGVQKNCSYSKHEFLKTLFKEVVSREAQLEADTKAGSQLLDPFGQVYVIDSSCINLPENSASAFPGSYSKKGNAATAKIQLLMELKSDKFLDISLGCFRDSDGKHAPSVLDRVKEGDLLIWDLGYWGISNFKQIEKQGGYYLSLLKKNVSIFDKKGKKINLKKQLSSAETIGKNFVTINVVIGIKNSMKTRIVATKLPKNIATRKRNELRKNRDLRLKPNEESFYFAGWQILITNVPEQIWTVAQASKAYRLRWRIEIVFKCLKSKLGAADFFKKNKMQPAYAETLLYLMMTWVTLKFVCSFIKAYRLVKKHHGVAISMLKYADGFMLNPQMLYSLEEDDHRLIKVIAYHCKYEKRRKRKNHEQKMYDDF